LRGESPQAQEIQAERALHHVHDVALDGERQGTPPDPRPEGTAGMIFSELRARGWECGCYAACMCALVLLLATGVQTLRLHYVEGRNTKLAQVLGHATADAQIAARKAEAEKAQAIATIADKYEQDKRDADEAQKRLVADLRAGNVRLQNRWRGCVSDIAATAAERDAAAADRDASAARVVRAARDADDQIRALQAIVKADRK
jgi:hypothetical protein